MRRAIRQSKLEETMPQRRTSGLREREREKELKRLSRLLGLDFIP